jgi:hypothetical protein
MPIIVRRVSPDPAIPPTEGLVARRATLPGVETFGPRAWLGRETGHNKVGSIAEPAAGPRS